MFSAKWTAALLCSFLDIRVCFADINKARIGRPVLLFNEASIKANSCIQVYTYYRTMWSNLMKLLNWKVGSSNIDGIVFNGDGINLDFGAVDLLQWWRPGDGWVRTFPIDVPHLRLTENRWNVFYWYSGTWLYHVQFVHVSINCESIVTALLE